MDVHELVRPEPIGLVLKNRFQPPSSRGLVNLIVNGEQCSGIELAHVVAAIGLHL